MELHGKYKVIEIKKKTQARFFRELKVGDTFELSYSLNGMYKYQAPYIEIFVDGEYVHRNNASQLSSNLNNFKLQELPRNLKGEQ